MNSITNTSSNAWELQKEYIKVGQTTEKENIQQNSESTSTNNSSSPNVDEYVHSEKPDSTGIYQLGRDKDGKPKILFNSQQNASKTPKPSEAPEKADGSEKENETCTVNTNKVDSEVKKLKKEITTLKQQIVKASDDEKKNLQKQLEQLENELSTKDNDSYRRQHSNFTSSSK